LKINVPWLIRDAAKSLYSSYKSINDMSKALKMHELYIENKDVISKKNNQKELFRNQYKYAYEKQADSLKIEQKRKDDVALKDAAISKKDAENKNLIIITGFITLILLVVITIISVNRLRSTKRQKIIIEQQKQIVEDKNNDILDSIQYAKRLQDAILPSEKHVKYFLPKSFIFYFPKDIVAGDFYWVENLGDWTFFASADCTGHGVPGAMVSVVCSNALTKSLLEEKIVEPAEILNRSRELVIQRFMKSEKQIMDGMDISLCAYNKSTGEINWAGANNPLWIIRKGSKEIEVLKADSQPIGDFNFNTPFTNHILKLSEGDQLYLFTDGFVDQFGGENGKKYKSANFKKFLLSISDKSMVQQKQLLSNEFYSWKGDLEQIDDVCVMGVKI